MPFRLVTHNWHKEFSDALETDNANLCIICPFIKYYTIKALNKHIKLRDTKIITRLNERHFLDGVSDIHALKYLLDLGATIRSVKNIHTKLYIFGDHTAFITSANLTEIAFRHNNELGIIIKDKTMVTNCQDYFNTMWEASMNDVTLDICFKINEKITNILINNKDSLKTATLTDHSTAIKINTIPTPSSPFIFEHNQSFVKFFGLSHPRKNRSKNIETEVLNSETYLFCAYPKSKRPRQPQNGDIMFIATFINNPDDISIIGRAIAMKHDEERDVATKEEIQNSTWKIKWPNYIRVHHPEFINGTLNDGISLYTMIEELGTDSFASTQARKYKSGDKRINPKDSYKNQPAIRLSTEGFYWINEKLENAFVNHGKLTMDNLAP